jgi:hypothetical protein
VQNCHNFENKPGLRLYQTAFQSAAASEHSAESRQVTERFGQVPAILAILAILSCSPVRLSFILRRAVQNRDVCT